MALSKTDYLLYRECKKSTWLKIHKPSIYYQHELTPFEKMIIQTGNEVELVARELFANGILIEGRDSIAQALTLDYIHNRHPILFQAVFEKDGFLAAIDILELNSDTNKYKIYEVKSTNEIDEKTHHHDLAFQVNLLRNCEIEIESVHLIHLNKEYIRNGELNAIGLFAIDDVTDIIDSLSEEVALEMDGALEYLSQENLPEGNCLCVYKGRSKHCACFSTLNPEIPEYSIHDIARIGLSKKKLEELVDSNFFNIHEVPPHIQLSVIQQNQVDVHKFDKIILDKEAIVRELSNLQFPIYFLDYETLPCAIPRFSNFSPYQHIPFQYSLYILDSPDAEPRHLEFIHVDGDDPSSYFVSSLKEHIGDTGSVIVWNKTFECGRNNELAIRIPEMKEYLESLNGRVFDLMDIFKKQYYVHKDFKGRISIKNVLPVLVPTLTYKGLDIKDGGSAAEIWNKLTTDELSDKERTKIVESLKKYCGMDAFAMYMIWKELYQMVN